MIFVATNIANALNLLLSIGLVRLLDPETFGQISAFFAVQLLGMLLISGWQSTLVVHLGTMNPHERACVATWAYSRARPLILATLVVGAVLMSFASQNETSVFELIFLCAALLLALGMNFWLVNLRAFDLISGNNARFAANLVIENGSKVGLILIGAFFTQDPIVLAALCTVSQVVPFLFYANVFKSDQSVPPEPTSLRLGRRFILLQGGFFAFFDSDLVLATMVEIGAATGQLAVLSLAAKIIYFAFAGLTIAAIADVSRLDQRSSVHKVRIAAALLVCGSLVIVVVNSLFPQLAYLILTGTAEYAGKTELIIILASSALFTLNSFVMNVLCASSCFAWMTPFIVVAVMRSLMVLATFVMGGSIVLVLTVGLVAQIILTGLILSLAAFHWKGTVHA